VSLALVNQAKVNNNTVNMWGKVNITKEQEETLDKWYNGMYITKYKIVTKICDGQ